MPLWVAFRRSHSRPLLTLERSFCRRWQGQQQRSTGTEGGYCSCPFQAGEANFKGEKQNPRQVGRSGLGARQRQHAWDSTNAGSRTSWVHRASNHISTCLSLLPLQLCAPAFFLRGLIPMVLSISHPLLREQESNIPNPKPQGNLGAKMEGGLEG